AEKVFPATPQQDFCLAVDVGEPPVVVECEERVGDAFQDRASALLLLSGLGLGALPLSDVPGKAAGVDELPIAPQHAGVDEDLFDRAILAAEPSWILFQLFICPQSIEDVADHVLVSVKLSDRMTDVFIPAVAEHVHFGLIGPKNCSIWTHPMQPDGRTLEKVSQLLLAPPEFVFRGLSLHELPDTARERSHHFHKARVGAPEPLIEELQNPQRPTINDHRVRQRAVQTTIDGGGEPREV